MQFFERPYSRGESLAWIEKQRGRYATDGHGYWVVEDKSAKLPVGQAGLLKIELEGVEEIGLGYLIHRPFWGAGFATEAAAACRDHAFQSLNTPRLVCPIRPENLPSQRVALKIGMKPGRQIMFAGFNHLIFFLAPGWQNDS
jgi:RimJ/RimL family protein N-acetyltransferase